MRIYLPATVASLRCALDAGKLGPAPIAAYAVTPALREWYVEGDIEELEYAAMTAAARRSLRLLGHEPGTTPRRRVVIAADVVDREVAFAGELHRDPGAVSVVAPVSLDAVVSAHVDDPAAEPDIAAAVTALPSADTGDTDAAFTVDGAEGHELAWYAVQEIPDVLALFPGRGTPSS